MRRAFARFINHPLRFGVRLGQNFGMPLLRLRQLLFNFLGVELSLFNSFFAVLRAWQ